MRGASEMERGTRTRETVLVIKGAIRGAVEAWKKVGLPSGSSVQCGAVVQVHVDFSRDVRRRQVIPSTIA